MEGDNGARRGPTILEFLNAAVLWRPGARKSLAGQRNLGARAGGHSEHYIRRRSKKRARPPRVTLHRRNVMFRFASTGAARRTSVPRRARTPARAVARPEAQPLERRTLLAAFVVTDAGDGGPGTLRQAILDANTSVGPDTITFNLPGAGALRTIRPLSALPDVTGPTSIDGRTQAGVAVELDGSLAGPGVNGLTVGGSDSLIRGLVINRFGGHGLALAPTPVNGRPGPTPSGIRVELNYIGTDWTGNVAMGNGGAGVMVSAERTVVGQNNPRVGSPVARNVISGNGYAGVWVKPPPGTSGSLVGVNVAGNYIGTDAAGGRPLGNGREGILVEAGGSTTVGGTAAQARNVISGNASSGIRLGGTGQYSILNNYIGTDFAGANAVPNGWSAAAPFHDGITVANTTIGFIGIGAAQPSTATSSSRNLISGNAGAGVNVVSGGEVHVIGNYIGTDATGNADLGNGSHGVVLQGTATTAAYGRVTGDLISGNGGDGIRVGASARLAVPIGGNYVGTNATGTATLGNDGNGINVEAGPTGVRIGAETLPPPVTNPPAPINPAGTLRNLISANGGDGIRVAGDGRTISSLAVFGNYIGTDVTGTVPLGNHGSGVFLDNVVNSIVGGESSPGGNLISANGGNGITVMGSVTALASAQANNHIQSNRIGTAAPDPRNPATELDPGDNAGLGNHGNGVAIYYSSHNRVGITGGNVIAYNDGGGILVEGSPTGSAPGNTAVGNYFGQNSIYGNGGLGIDLVGGGMGVTPNDPLDADSGANGLQNYPVITEAVANAAGTSVQIHFTLTTAPGSYRIEFYSSPLPDPSGYGEGRTNLSIVTVTTDASGVYTGTITRSIPAGNAAFLYYTATAMDNSNQNTSEFSRAVRGVPPPPTPQNFTTVTRRTLFYNNSIFDGNTPANLASDGSATATDKQALLPGQAATFANVSSYSKGINGMSLMFFGLGAPAQLTADDLELRMGTGGDPTAWAPAPAPNAITLVPVPGPNTLYNLTWPDGAIRNTWLRVTVKANGRTGLAAPDVFYFGNLVGEVGDGSTLVVDALDLLAVRRNFFSNSPVTGRFDFDRDGKVTAADFAIVRSNYLNRLGGIIFPPAVAAPAVEDRVASARVADEVLR
jgi:hypothetical protein